MITIAVLLLMSAGQLMAGWVEDAEFRFKIQVPDNWKRSILNDGTDRIHVFLSPDENVGVRIRAFKVPEKAALDMIIPLFEKNILGGGQRKALMDYTLNGYQGKVGAYTGTYNGIQIGAGAFFTIQNGIAYIVWSLTPINMFQSRHSESDAITNTFFITGGTGSLSNTISTRLPNTFASAGLGYTIGYPADWTYMQTKPTIVVFSGREGTPAYYATINIQNLASTLIGGNFSSLNEVMNHFQKQLFNGATNVNMSQINPYTFTSGSRTFQGSQIEMTYKRQGESFKQWLLVFPRYDQKLYYAFSYTAAAADFQTYLDIATQMLNNWIIQ